MIWLPYVSKVLVRWSSLYRRCLRCWRPLCVAAVHLVLRICRWLHCFDVTAWRRTWKNLLAPCWNSVGSLAPRTAWNFTANFCVSFEIADGWETTNSFQILQYFSIRIKVKMKVNGSVCQSPTIDSRFQMWLDDPRSESCLSSSGQNSKFPALQLSSDTMHHDGS